MPTELLIETVTMLKQRIELRRQYFLKNEIPTRQLLVDPLLQVLGWNFEDSTRVRLEHPVGPRRADYVLLIDGQPRIVVEAKRYGSPLGLPVIRQAFDYAVWLQARDVLITDGDRWRMYRIVSANRHKLDLAWEVGVSELAAESTSLTMERLSYTSIRSEQS